MATTVVRPERTTSRILPRRHYARPPVVEALVNIQVEPRHGIDPVSVAGVMDGEAGRYPAKQEMHNSNLTFDLGTGAKTGETTALEGYRYIAPNTQGVVQVRTGSLTVSKLPPYEGWEILRDETLRLWPRYAGALDPKRISRMAVRYINRVDLPYTGPGSVKLDDYFFIYPVMAGGAGLAVRDFMVRIDTFLPSDPDVRLTVTQGRQLNPDPSLVSVVLDIEAARELTLPPGDADQFVNHIEKLHTVANDAFEGCITPRARDLFQ